MSYSEDIAVILRMSYLAWYLLPKVFQSSETEW